jgi:hypothetical protein
LFSQNEQSLTICVLDKILIINGLLLHQIQGTAFDYTGYLDPERGNYTELRIRKEM